MTSNERATGDAHRLHDAVELDLRGLSEHSRKIIASANDLNQCATVREQCALLRLKYKLSIPEISKAVRKNRGTVARHISKSVETPQNVGRPSLLSEEIMESLERRIEESFANGCPVTYNDIQDFIHNEFGLMILVDTIRHIVSRNPRWRLVSGIPMESVRMEADEDEIERYFELLASDLEGVPAHLVFNADECGFDEWQDRQTCQAIVPSHYAKNSILVPVNRQTRRSTLLACIAADGSNLQPFVIVSRKTVSNELN